MRLLWAPVLFLLWLPSAGWPPAIGASSRDYLCGLDAELEVVPSSPTTADPVRVIAAGTWADSCVPAYEAHEVGRGVIRIDATVPSIGGCLTVITPWQFTAEVGSLAAGAYQVQLILSGPFGEPARLCAKAEVEVLLAPAWRVLLPLMPKPELGRPAGGMRGN